MLMLHRMQRPNDPSRRPGRFLLALLLVLVAQVLPCVAGPALAGTPKAHCHDDASPGPQPMVSSPGCKHCLLLATTPAPDQDRSAGTDGSIEPDVAAMVSAVPPRRSRLPSRIEPSHPPPRPPLEDFLQHRVLLI